MRTYVFKRLVLFIPTLVIVTVLVFGILRVVPGDPAMLILGGESGDDEFTEEQLAALRKKLGTDRNIIIQYFTWTSNMLKGDFGTSYFYEGDQVIDDLIDRVPTTVELALLALVLASVMAVPLGVISALKQDGDCNTQFLGCYHDDFLPGTLLQLGATISLRRPMDRPLDQLPTVDLPGAGLGNVQYGIYHTDHPLSNAGSASRGLYQDGAFKGPVRKYSHLQTRSAQCLAPSRDPFRL